MKKEINPAIVLVVLAMVIGGIITVFARSSGCGHNPSQRHPNDYKLRPGQMRAKRPPGNAGAPTQ